MNIERFNELHSSISKGLATIGIDMEDLDELLLWQRANPDEYLLVLEEERKASLEDERENQAVLDAFMKSLSPEQHELYLEVEEDLVAKVIREMNEEARASA